MRVCVREGERESEREGERECERGREREREREREGEREGERVLGKLVSTVTQVEGSRIEKWNTPTSVNILAHYYTHRHTRCVCGYIMAL